MLGKMRSGPDDDEVELVLTIEDEASARAQLMRLDKGIARRRAEAPAWGTIRNAFRETAMNDMQSSSAYES